MEGQQDHLICRDCGNLVQGQSYCSQCGRHVDDSVDRGHFLGLLLLRTRSMVPAGGGRRYLFAIILVAIILLVGNLSALYHLVGSKITLMLLSFIIVAIIWWTLDHD